MASWFAVKNYDLRNAVHVVAVVGSCRSSVAIRERSTVSSCILHSRMPPNEVKSDEEVFFRVARPRHRS
jgi:hypothetical protein